MVSATGGIVVVYADAAGTLAFSLDFTNTTLKNNVKDVVGEMVSGNIESGIDVYYKSDKTLDFEVKGLRGPAFPSRPYDGQQFTLTADATLKDNKLIVADQFSGDTIQKRFPLVSDATRTAESNTVSGLGLLVRLMEAVLRQHAKQQGIPASQRRLK